MPTIEIKVPLGKKIRFGKNIDRIGVWIERNYYHEDENSFADTEWTSDDAGFLCSDCGQNVRIYKEVIEENEVPADTIATEVDTVLVDSE